MNNPVEVPKGDPVAQLLARRTIDREVESSNQASDSDKCHRVAKGWGPLQLEIPPAPRK